MELVDFLRARLDEDEAVARALVDDRRPGRTERWEFCDDGAIRDTGPHRSLRVKFTWSPEAAHIARHDPARVLAEVEAGRELLKRYEHLAYSVMPDDFTGVWALEAVMRSKARAHRDHSDFNPSWLED